MLRQLLCKLVMGCTCMTCIVFYGTSEGFEGPVWKCVFVPSYFCFHMGGETSQCFTKMLLYKVAQQES